MIGRVWSIIFKEVIQIRRDPRTLAIVLAMPLMQLILFGYAINTTVDHIATVVLDQARDAHSRAFLATFFNTGYFDLVHQVGSVEQVRQAIDDGSARVGIVVPPDFSHDLVAGRAPRAQLVIDGSDPNTAQTALLVGGALARPGRVAIDVRPIVLYNPSLDSINFMIPGLLGLILQFQTLLLTAFAVVRERERGTLEQLVVTPVKPWELMLGKILPYVAIAFANLCLASGIGRFWFGVEFAGSFGMLLALAGLFLLSSLGLGLLVSTVSQTQTQAMQMALFIMLPSIILSGFVFPREGMPHLIRELGLLIPLTYFLQILRGIILKGVGLEVLWPQVLALAAFGVIVFGLSANLFRKTMD
ncbi:MAG: ABC transporter permease [Chloroflexota bacterium]|nr:ABC transporter permease [Chloroflexota bacterium]